MIRESSLWRWLRKGTVPLIGETRLHICRVENAASAGYPDVEGCFDGVQFHIELKIIKQPIRKSTLLHVQLSKEQIIWHETRWTVGGRCFILVQMGRGRYLFPGFLASDLVNISQLQFIRMSRIQPDADAVNILKAVKAQLPNYKERL